MMRRSFSVAFLCLGAACGSVSQDPDASPNPGSDAPVSDAEMEPDAMPASDCGNSVLEDDERCDDGGLTGGDGCSATCTVEPFFRCTDEPSTCHRVRVLYAPSATDDTALRSAIAAFTGGLVDFVDASLATPTPAQLESYDCVYTWASSAYVDPVAFGDTLADHVDLGNSVVLGGFVTYTMGNSLAGRILTSTYSPCGNPTGNNHIALSDYAADGTSQIHTGVTAYASTFRDILVLQGAGVQDGTYADGEIATAYRPDFHVVYVNGVFGTNDLTATGDYARLLANACSAAFQ